MDYLGAAGENENLVDYLFGFRLFDFTPENGLQTKIKMFVQIIQKITKIWNENKDKL